MMDTLMQDDANNVIDDDGPHDNPTMLKRVKADSPHGYADHISELNLSGHI